MKKILYFFCVTSIILLTLFAEKVFANNILSSSHQDESICIADKQKNDSLYPGYSRSDCFEVGEKFFYNICQWNYCPIPNDYLREWGLKNSQQIEQLTEILEDKLEGLESEEVIDWSKDFWNILEKLKKKYENNTKSLALLEDIQKEFKNISKKQIEQNSLCKDTYGRGWQEAEKYFETINTFLFLVLSEFVSVDDHQCIYFFLYNKQTKKQKHNQPTNQLNNYNHSTKPRGNI